MWKTIRICTKDGDQLRFCEWPTNEQIHGFSFMPNQPKWITLEIFGDGGFQIGVILMVWLIMTSLRIYTMDFRFEVVWYTNLFHK